MGGRLETYLTWDVATGQWAYGIYVDGEPARGGFATVKANALVSLRHLAREYGADGYVDGNGTLTLRHAS